MLRLYIMCGLAFSGKSTLARQIAKHTRSTLIAFDKLWVEKDKQKTVSKDTEGWQFIRKIGQNKVSKALKEGVSVVYDDNNIRFEHREELRVIAKKYGAQDIVVYLNTPMKLIRKRESDNRVIGARHEVEPENFQTVIKQLQVPTSEENMVEFTPATNIGDWLKDL